MVPGNEGDIGLMVMSALGLSPNDGIVPPIGVRSPFLYGTTADYRLRRGTAMNYYPHHIGDFNSATRHLTRIERSVYRDLIELYYDTEKPLATDLNVLCRKIIATSEQESTAVQQVLNEFFTKTEQGWLHERCESEIQKYQGSKRAKSAAGRASAEKRINRNVDILFDKQELTDSNECSSNAEQESTAVQQVLNEYSTNQEPRTNIKTVSKKPESRKTSISGDFCITPELREWAAKKGIGNLDDHLEPFITTCRAKGYKYSDWHCAFQKAVTGDWAKIGHGTRAQRKFVPA